MTKTLLGCVAAATLVLACQKATTPLPDTPASSATVAARAESPARPRDVGTDPGKAGTGTPLVPRSGNELAMFAAGCFWGVEDTFRQVPGVVATAVGYTGGHTESPTYREVCTHTTGHAEAVLVEFDPAKVTFATLLRVFFQNHDPTTRNRQGPDVGDQYRSAIFTFSRAQEDTVREVQTDEQRKLPRPIVTGVSPATRFWKAEEYHQQYDEKTGTHSCPLPRGLSKS